MQTSPEILGPARQMFPEWMVWFGYFFTPTVLFFWAILLVESSVRISGYPLRSASDEPWTERARRVYPIRLNGKLNTLFLGFLFSVGLFWGEKLFQKNWLVLPNILAGYAGGALVQYWTEKSVRGPLLTFGKWVRAIFLILMLKYLPFVAALILFVVLPVNLNENTLWMFLLGAITIAFLGCGGGFRIARALGLIHPPSDRLRIVMESMKKKTGVTPRFNGGIIFPSVNAWALPIPKAILVTDAMLEVLNDEELAGVCAHELGHLTESVPVLISRYGPFLACPLLVASGKMIFHHFGLKGFAFALLFIAMISNFQKKVARKMEERADKFAHLNQGNPAAFARALERMYEANLVPAVMSKGKREIHPHLYDRLLAAGIQPSFPRPEPPPVNKKWTGFLLTVFVAIGFLISFQYAVRRANWRLSSLGNERALLLGTAISGGDPWGLSNLAWYYFRHGNLEKAVILYRAAAALDPNSIDYPSNLALVLLNMKRFQEAEAALGDAGKRVQWKSRTPREISLLSKARVAIKQAREGK